MTNSPPKRFAIALSFPGDRQDFVEQVADHLSKAVTRERVLYYKYYEAEFARTDLDVYLPDLYCNQSELIVIFLCPEYRQKRWCLLEWRHIRQLIATTEQHRIMLVSFGDPGNLRELGILPGDGYLDIGSRPPEEIAAHILQRTELPVSTPTAAPAKRTVAPSGKLRHANPNFVGRREELTKLTDAVFAGKIGVVAAVHGVGGMGKTELAVKFANNESARFTGGCGSSARKDTRNSSLL